MGGGIEGLWGQDDELLGKEGLRNASAAAAASLDEKGGFVYGTTCWH